MTILEHIELVNETRKNAWSDSQAFKEALCDFGIEVAKIKKAFKLKKAKHKMEYGERNYNLRETIKTDAERCRIIDHDMQQEVLDIAVADAEATELNDIYWAFRTLLPKNEYNTDTF